MRAPRDTKRTAAEARPVPRDARIVLRFVLGALELVSERLVGELRAVAGQPTATPPAPERSRRLLGAMLVVPAKLTATARAVTRSLTDLASPLARLVRDAPPGAFITRVRDGVASRLEAWDALGRAEAAAARELAATTLARLYAEAFARIAGPELSQLIADESAGLTRSVVRDLQQLSEDADSRAERLVGRLRRRR